MKKACFCLPIFLLLLIIPVLRLKAQEFEIQQLLLNVQKLSQLEAILSQMKKGYQILDLGYNTIKNLSEGNFSLHKTFLDGLLQVSPTVKKYKRIADIVMMQQQLVAQYKKAYAIFRGSKVFNEDELTYIEKVYSGLFDGTLKNLDELLMIVTAGELRMNDAERLNAIDRLYDDMQDKLHFLRSFNQRTTLLGTQRQKLLNDNQSIEQLQSK